MIRQAIEGLLMSGQHSGVPEDILDLAFENNEK